MAFGLFDHFVEPTRGPEWRLVAFALMKRVNYDRGIEIKGPFLDASSYQKFELKGAQLSAKLQDVQQSLLEKIIRFCEVRNYPKIEMELPQLDHDRVTLALSLDFKVTSLREKYRPGSFVYLMEKTLGATYQGDPFDLDAAAEWFMTTILPCKKAATATFFIREFLAARHVYEVPMARRLAHVAHNHEAHLDSAHQLAEKLSFKCELVTVSPAALPSLTDAELRNMYDQANCVRYLLTDSDAVDQIAAARAKCDREHIRLLILSELREFGGGVESAFSIPFTEDAVGGVVSALEPENAERLLNKDGLIYFLMSDVGYGLDYEADRKIIAFYSPFSNENEHFFGEIWGAAIIDSGHHSTFKKAYKYYKENYVRFLSEADLLYLQAYSEEESVLVVKCVEFRKFNPAIRLESIPDSMGGKAYLVQQLVGNTSSGAYIHNDIKNGDYTLTTGSDPG